MKSDNKAQQIHLHKALSNVVGAIPEPPSKLRYYDLFTDRTHTIPLSQDRTSYDVVIDGAKRKLDLSQLTEVATRFWIKFLAYRINKNVSGASAFQELDARAHLNAEVLHEILTIHPIHFPKYWETLRTKGFPASVYHVIKQILHMLCDFSISEWSAAHHARVKNNLPSPSVDKFRAVRTGKAFLTCREEAAIVEYLDHLSQPEVLTSITGKELADATLLACCYQHGVRAMQAAILDLRDITIWRFEDKSPPRVHLRYKMIKQRKNVNHLRLLKRIVKTEWTPIIVKQHDISSKNSKQNGQRLLGFPDAITARRRLALLLKRLTGRAITATNLRHTAAMRLVDAGATKEELADFLGHSDLNTCQVYFDASANQATRINNALGLSETYQKIAEVATIKFISPDDLKRLKGEQQIAGVPHGIPIAGIGRCTVGQPSCPYNPVSACYDCRRFMPVRDIKVHQKVLEDFRGVVRNFYDASRQEEKTSAYAQLKRTVTNIDATIVALEDDA